MSVNVCKLQTKSQFSKRIVKPYQLCYWPAGHTSTLAGINNSNSIPLQHMDSWNMYKGTELINIINKNNII
jgi:hypothetical protein